MPDTDDYGNQLSEMNNIYNSIADNGQTDVAQTVGTAIRDYIASTMSTQISVDESG